MKRLTSLCMAILVCVVASAQYTITGKVIDSKDSQPLIGAAVTIATEGGQPEGQISDLDGNFTVQAKPGKYTFKVAYTGYTAYEKQIEVKADMKMGNIKMKEESKDIAEVKVTGVQVRQEQRGDTTVFNAAAFKVNPDATTEDLLKKMPGMTVEGGQVKSGGESIKKVLVDGKEFFGDDPMMALKNVPADMVSSIEVFDKASDQAEFTGFSDGQEERTINIMTKMGIQSGYFGKVFAGYGTDDRFESGGNLSYFRGNHSITLLGTYNNINQQNFGYDDDMGGGMGGGMFGGFGGGRSGGPNNRTGSIGFNYSYEKENKLEMTLSYFYNDRKNASKSRTLNEYNIDEEKGETEADQRISDSERDNENRNYNHRANLRLEWTINDYNSLIFTPNISWSDSEREGLNSSLDMVGGVQNMRTYSFSLSESSNVQSRGRLLWRHKFDKDHRTLSLSVGLNGNGSDSNDESKSEREYDKVPLMNLFTMNQTTNNSKNYTFNGSLQYTEPIGDNMALQFNYSPSYTYRDGDKNVMSDTVKVKTDEYTNFRFSPDLSNKMSSEYTIHKGGVALNIYNDKTFNATIGLDFQNSELSSEREYPIVSSTKASFNSLMPSVNLRYRQGQTVNARLRYNTRTSAPSIDNLQEVLDVSNARYYSIGNANLEQQFTHNVNLFFSTNNVETSRFIFLMFGFNYTLDYITNATTLYQNIDTTLMVAGKELVLPRGVEFSRPENLNGQYSTNFNLTYSQPVMLLRSTANINIGANLSNTPVKVNNEVGANKNYMFMGGLSLASNISENLDFTVGYNGNYTIQDNSFTVGRNNYSHTISADLSCLFFQQRLVFTNRFAHQMTSGMGNDFDNSYILWNASAGLKFFKDRGGELRVKVQDLLNKSQSISQSSQSTYLQTTEQEVLGRYVMVTLSYKLRKMGNMKNNNMMGGFPMGGFPGGGFGGGRRR